jgi:hypothetical protein
MHKLTVFGKQIFMFDECVCKHKDAHISLQQAASLQMHISKNEEFRIERKVNQVRNALF